MARLSIVLVIHREQAWLEPSTTSILAHPSGDLELVAIDDASPDHAPEMLDALAEADGRVRVHHLSSRLGTGAARNLGLDTSAGDYVWFLAPTDEVAPGAIERIVARLDATSPDVLLLDRTRADRLGRTRRGPHHRLVERLADAGAVTLEQRPALAALPAGDVGDVVLDRQLLHRLGARAGQGAHGGLALTWPALLAADRIAALPSVAGVSRPRDPRAAEPATGIIESYEAVFRFLDGEPAVPQARRALVAPAMLRHLLAELARVPEPERRAFFRRASEVWRAHGRPDAVPPGRTGRLRATLLERDAYAAYRRLEDAARARTAVTHRRAAAARLRGRLAGHARQTRLERHYRSRLEQPLDPGLAVYGAYWFRGYACNPRAIYERAREMAPHIRGVWVVKEKAADSIPAGVEHVVLGTPEYFDVIARAAYLINNVNFPDHLVAREGAVHVQTHHGTPLKHMGLDLRNSLKAGRGMNFDGLLRRVDRWDLSLSQNAYSTLIWERVYPGRYESLEIGYPRNDRLAAATAEDFGRIRQALGIAPRQTAVLYAPTHREYLDGYVPTVDLAAFAEALGPDHVVLVRQHYFYDPDPALRELHDAGRIRDVASHPSIEELCLAADVLVTDYSSLMFDYAVLDRPIVIHAPDWDVYRVARGTYFDLLESPPGVVSTSQPELIDALTSRYAWSDEAAADRADFRARFCSLDDGGAAARVVRRLWGPE